MCIRIFHANLKKMLYITKVFNVNMTNSGSTLTSLSFLDPQQSQQGSYKFGLVRTPVCDASFNFIETWH